MQYPITVTLQRPVTVNGKTIERLEFDEPDMGTSIAVEEARTPGAQTAALLAGMAGVDLAVIHKVKERDFHEIERLVLEPYQADVAARRGEASGNDRTAE